MLQNIFHTFPTIKLIKSQFTKLLYFIQNSYHVYIDENGDASGNYTVLARGWAYNKRNTTGHGLIPVGTFDSPKGDDLPVS